MTWIASRLPEPFSLRTASTANLVKWSLWWVRSFEDNVVPAMFIKSWRNLTSSELKRQNKTKNEQKNSGWFLKCFSEVINPVLLFKIYPDTFLSIDFHLNQSGLWVPWKKLNLISNQEIQIKGYYFPHQAGKLPKEKHKQTKISRTWETRHCYTASGTVN